MMFSLIAAGLAHSCAAAQEPAPAADCVPTQAEWRRFVTEDDRRRLRRWRNAWTEALEQARSAGHGDEIVREGTLLDPDAALLDPVPPAGDYDCRTIKIGSPGGLLAYVAYPAFRCRIAVTGNRLSFTKLSGSQRPVGRLFADEERRMVFLGTLQLGDERRSYQYGVDKERDLVAVLERADERRWRLVFPYPHFESVLDVIELVPSGTR